MARKTAPGGHPAASTAQEDTINAFVAILGAADADDYADLWEKEWATFADKAVTTRTIYTSRYRKAVRAELGDTHPALNFIKVLDRSGGPIRNGETRSGGGRKSTRANRIAVFGDRALEIKQIRDEALAQGKTPKQVAAPYKRAIEKLWKIELDDMRATLSGNTILTTTAAYRNTLRRNGMDDELTLSFVRPPEELQKERARVYRNSIVDQHSDLVAMPHWREILEKAISLLPATDASWTSLDDAARERAKDISREDAVVIGLALGLVTGRRPYEVFCQGVFGPVPLMVDPTMSQAYSVKRGYEIWRVLFSGQAKTRGQEGTSFDQSFPIPVLTKARDVVFAWLVLRYSEDGQLWREMANEEFKHDLLRDPNPRAILPPIRERIFAPLWPKIEKEDTPNVVDAKKIKAHNIRSLYAEIADQFWRPKSKSKASYFSEILGHTEKDIETANSYMKYYLPDQKDGGPTRRVKRRLAEKIESAPIQGENKPNRSAVPTDEA